MTTEIKKPNYTQVPNAILDNLDKFTPAEIKVLMAIARQTFGYHQKRKKMSISFIQKATGLSRQGVVNTIDALMASGIVRRRRSGNGYEYSLHIIDELVNSVDQSTPPASQLSVPVLVNSVDHLDENSQLSVPVLVNSVDTKKETIKETLLFKEKKESELGSAVIPPKLRTQLVNALLDTTGKRKLADAGDDNVLNRAHDDVVILWNMGFKGPDQIYELAEGWKRNDWRGQKGNTPTAQQLKEYASQNTPATPAKRTRRKVEFVDSFTGQTVIEEVIA